MAPRRNSKSMPFAFKQHIHQCFELPILKPEVGGVEEKARYTIVGYWYTHYIDGHLHRQMKLIKHKAPVCLIRHKHDDPAFHVHDFDTTLDRFRRTAVTIDDFEALWAKYLPKSVNLEPSNVKINIPKQPIPIAPPATVAPANVEIPVDSGVFRERDYDGHPPGTSVIAMPDDLKAPQAAAYPIRRVASSSSTLNV